MVTQKDFVEAMFVPMILQFKPGENSLGLRVKKLIEADPSHCASLVYGKMNSNKDYFPLLINASSTYIKALKKIQSLE